MDARVLGVVVTAQGVLLVQYRDFPDVVRSIAGTWGIPGGAVEPGETREDALRRELLEETGLAVGTIAPVLDEIVHFVSDGREHQVTVYRCFAPMGEVVISSEHEAFAWVAPSELDRYVLVNQDIKDWIQRAYEIPGDMLG